MHNIAGPAGLALRCGFLAATRGRICSFGVHRHWSYHFSGIQSQSLRERAGMLCFFSYSWSRLSNSPLPKGSPFLLPPITLPIAEFHPPHSVLHCALRGLCRLHTILWSMAQIFLRPTANKRRRFAKLRRFHYL